MEHTCTAAHIITFCLWMHFQPNGVDMKVPFSSVKHLGEGMAYVPQLKIPGLSHPLLATDITKIDHEVIGWKEDARGYDERSFVVEATRILGFDPGHVIFCPIRQWPTSSVQPETTKTRSKTIGCAIVMIMVNQPSIDNWDGTLESNLPNYDGAPE